MWYKLGQVICNLHTIFANTDARSFSSYNPRTNNWISATVRCRFHILLIYISSSVIITLRFSYTYIFLPIPDINNAYIMTFTREDRRSEEHTSERQSRENLVCRLLLEKKNYMNQKNNVHVTSYIFMDTPHQLYLSGDTIKNVECQMDTDAAVV